MQARVFKSRFYLLKRSHGSLLTNLLSINFMELRKYCEICFQDHILVHHSKIVRDKIYPNILLLKFHIFCSVVAKIILNNAKALRSILAFRQLTLHLCYSSCMLSVFMLNRFRVLCDSVSKSILRNYFKLNV